MGPGNSSEIEAYRNIVAYARRGHDRNRAVTLKNTHAYMKKHMQELKQIQFA